MADEIDRANDIAEMFLANSLKKQQGKLNQMTIHYAECCWCGDPTENGAKWCCPECRNDEERSEIAKARNHGRG